MAVMEFGLYYAQCKVYICISICLSVLMVEMGIESVNKLFVTHS